MLCEHYKEALIEAAASGAEPHGDLRAHLDGCAGCRAAFEQEQALFASIDDGLRVTANADVPASLLPRVRAQLSGQSVARGSWMWHASCGGRMRHKIHRPTPRKKIHRVR